MSDHLIGRNAYSTGTKSIVIQTAVFSMKRAICKFLLLLVVSLGWAMAAGTEMAYATGEIIAVKAPEEIPEGDDISVAVSATPVDPGSNRMVALEYPESWKVKVIYRVEAGSETFTTLPISRDMSDAFSKEPGQAVVAIADNTQDADPEAAGVAYFVTFTTKPIPGPNTTAALVKVALVERTDPDSPPEIDKKTRKPKPRNTAWRMVYPVKSELTFAGIVTKHLVESIRMLRLTRNARALVVDGSKAGTAELRTKPEVLTDYFSGAWSIEFWFKTTGLRQTFFRFTGGAAEIRLGTGLLGQPQLSAAKGQPIAARVITNDGAWHHLVLTKDSVDRLRMFVDAEPAISVQAGAGMFAGVTGVSIGVPKSRNDFSIDELRLLRIAYTEPSDFERTISVSGRDTMSDAFAIFHFDEYGSVSRSSVPLIVRHSLQSKDEFIPMMFSLDSEATLVESSSPVQFDPVMLSADLLSPTHVSISWHTTSELGIKQFQLERRVGSFGAFEKVLTSEAKHGLRAPKRGQSIISHNSYNAEEDLPKLNGYIELYYRLAIIGFNEKEPPIYSQPINVEYGADRDVFVEQNQPNPFNPTTNIAIRVTKETTMRLSVFDIIGREVDVLVNGKVSAGRHVYTLDATNWPGGIYFYKVKTAKSTVTRKMVLAK